MKKILILVMVLFFACSAVFADIIPMGSKNIAHYGCGVLNLPDSFTVYSEPDESSKIIKTINYEESANSAIINQQSSLDTTIIAYVPSKSIALVTVETNQEDGWFEIYYDQKTGKTGWVKQPNLDEFKTWKEAFYSWGKKNGLYFFKDIPEAKRTLYSSDSDTSQKIGSLTLPKYINFSIITGNWMLVNVLDLGQKTTKIGWIRWRNEDGTLILFPNFK